MRKVLDDLIMHIRLSSGVGYIQRLNSA